MGVAYPPARRRPFVSFLISIAAAAVAGVAGAAVDPPRAQTGARLATPAGVAAASSPGAARAARIADPQLLRRLAGGGTQTFLIRLRERADLSAAYGMNWRDRGRYVYGALRDTAERSQAKVRAALVAQGAHIRPYWIANAILVEDGSIEHLTRAAAFDEVERIAPPPNVAPVEPPAPAATGARAQGGIPENLRRIGADRVWDQGTTGSGVTVGVIDTGVLHTHEALRRQYRGYRGGTVDNDYNSLNPEGHTSDPHITGEHGTHVAGIVMGDNGNADPARRERIGVAPGAQWISCTALGTEAQAPEYMVECMQFMLAPTRTDGTQPDPDRRADIVNNSWMTGGTCTGEPDTLHQEMIEAWVAAGVLPVFAAGNTMNCDLPPTPGLSTVASPASLAASFAVGSTGNHDGRYAPHSLWGPTAVVSPGLPTLPDPRGYPQMKPQVVAPGVAIRSAFVGAEPYINMTGTSMSAPHVAGAFALMIEAAECLRGDYATLGTILMQTARPSPYDSGGTPPPGPGNVPNYATGWGEIDVPAAVDAAANACGPHGFLRGRVTGSDGQPVADANVDVAVPGEPAHRIRTGPDGRYARRMPQLLAGGYTVSVSAYGYSPASEGGILVTNATTTTHDVTLATAPTHKISGRVTDDATGWPLHARLAIAGYPGEPVWTDPRTGFYAIRLPEGTSYRFEVTTDVPGYSRTSRDVPDASVVAQDFTLAADVVTCDAPGYRYAGNLLDQGFESNGAAPPAGWTASSAGIGWRFGTSADVNGPVFQVPEHGRYAASNEEHGVDQGWGNDGSADYLVLPPLNLATVADPVLRFAYVFPGAGIGSASVEGSIDGGATWSPLGPIETTEYAARWTDRVISLAPLAGHANARVRFHVDDGSGEWQTLGSVFAVDDVAVRAGCTAPAQGALMIGHVRDANSGVALDGAQVRVGSAAPVTSFTSADPGVGAGFYATFAAPGSATLTAARGSLPAGYGDATATAAASDGAAVYTDLELPAGRLRLYPPGGPSATVELGSTAVVPFTVHNSGTAPLAFGLEATAVEEHFEGAVFPPPGWTVVNHGASPCVWTRLPRSIGNYAGGNGNAAAIDAYACNGSDVRIDSSLVSPALDLSTSATASAGFFVSLLDGADAWPRLDVDVSTNNGNTWTTAWSLTRSESDTGPGTLIEVDLTPYVGASAARVRLRYSQMPPWGWAIVDQLHLFNGLSMRPIVDVAPESGTLAPGATNVLQATFDARHYAQPGTYAESIRVAENTPYEWPFDGSVNATITVTAPASYGWFGGVARSLGACDIAPTPLAGATVRIRDASGDVFETTTDADGNYRYWLPAADGPFAISARAADHADAAERTATLAAGAQTRADIDLRVAAPCLMTDPAHLQANTAAGQSLTLPLQLMNGGAGATAWTVRAGGDPSQRLPLPLSQTLLADPEQDMYTGCRYGSGLTPDNLYLREFRLDERADPSQIATISGIGFAVGYADSPAGTQTVYARLYKRLGNELVLSNLHLLAEKAVAVKNGQLTRLQANFDEAIVVSRDTVVVAAVYAPDGVRDGNTFYAGFNNVGQTAPGYLVAPVCGNDEPTDFRAMFPGLPNFSLLLELDVIGSDPCHPRATVAPWLSVSPGSGTLAGDAATPLQAAFSPGALGNGSHRGSLCFADGSGKPIAAPVTLNVGAADTIFRNSFE